MLRLTLPLLLIGCCLFVWHVSFRESGPLPFRLPWILLLLFTFGCLLIANSVQVAQRGFFKTLDIPPKPGIAPSPCSCQPSANSRFKFNPVVFPFLIWCHLARLGEATVPGPVVGTFNGGGILHKAELVSTIPVGLWATCETHLTAAGVKKFQQDLKYRGSSARLIPGCPAPPLTGGQNCIGGKCTGVGLLSHYPVRALTSSFDKSRWETGRVQVGASCVEGTWIKVGVAYGFSALNKNQETMDQTDAILSELTTRILFQSNGPRILAGDFNTHYTLPQMEIWKMHGFVEVQAFAREKWGQAPQHTYRGQTTPDQLWVSPELIPHIRHVKVDSTYFADHALLFAELQGLPKFPSVHVWSQPHPIPWDKIASDVQFPQTEVPAPTDVDFLPRLFGQVETAVDAVLTRQDKPRLLPQQKGRCTKIEPKRITAPVAPLRRSRPSDVQVQFQGENFHHTQWCRQLRRLQSFARATRNVTDDHQSKAHKRALWQAIRNASGFAQGFPKSWETRTVDLPGTPRKLPKQPPDQQCAELIFAAFLKQFQQLETELINARVRHAKKQREQTPNLGFRDVAMPRALPVQTLALPRVAHVTDVDHDEGVLHYQPQVLDCTEPVFNQMGIIQVTHHTPGSCQVADVTHELSWGHTSPDRTSGGSSPGP